MASFGKALVVSTNEKKFIDAAIQEGVREDGRTLHDLRKIKISFREDAGTAEVQFGRTRVLAAVMADIVAPYPERPTEGMLSIHVNFSPIASPFFEGGRPSDQAVEIRRLCERAIRDSKAIDMEALCLMAGQKVWSIRCDVHVLNDDGNLIDAINLAAVAALRHHRRPDATIVGDRLTVHSVDKRQPVALAMHHSPISVTSAFFLDGASFLCDPTLKEEAVCEGTFTVTQNIHQELCCLQKPGGVGIALDTMLQCTQIASARAQTISALLEAALKKDEDSKHIVHSQTQPKRPIDAFGDNVTKTTASHLELELKAKEIAGEKEDHKESNGSDSVNDGSPDFDKMEL